VVIKGRVTDTSGRPVATALIGIAAFNASTTSDTHGAYRLVIRSRVRSGQHAVLTASREGYDFVSRAITLAPGAELTESFRLQPLE
jgi:protocatechuate 3,4-dioxygenase beta subunit